MHVLGCDLSPHGDVLRLFAHEMQVGVAGVPAARRLVDEALQRNCDARELTGFHVDRALEDAVLGSFRRDDLVRSGRHLSLVGAVHVKGLTLG